ncbi:MAG: oligosaccharide repeat unit polymerase [Prevotella sp.]|nr:oligosaccharide repeat unit polymerase [Prevotella sp.]
MEIGMIIVMGLLVAGFLSFKVGDVFAPWTITLLVWLAMLLLFQVQGDLLYPLGDQFLTCLLLWVPILVCTSLITYYLLPGAPPDEESTPLMSRRPAFNDVLFNFLYFISMVITPLYLYKIMKVVMMFDLSDMLWNLRILAVYGDESYGFLNYSYVLNQVLLVVAFWEYPRVPLWKVLTIVLASIMSAFAIMEKGMLFFLFSSMLYVLYAKRVIRMRSMVLSVLSVVLVFFLINIARDYREDADPNDAMTFLDFFGIYVMSPAVAFEQVQEDLTPQWGSHTFQTVYLFLARWGGDYEVNKKLQEFVWVPLPTNVYTIFQPFFEDFKYKGVAFFAFFYGVFSGWFYRLARNNNGFGKCVYAMVVYVLALQFYQENVMLSIVSLIQFIFFTYLVMQQDFGITWRSAFKKKTDAPPTEAGGRTEIEM